MTEITTYNNTIIINREFYIKWIFIITIVSLFTINSYYAIGYQSNSTIPISLFYNSPVLQSPSTQQILQKYFTQSNDQIAVFVVNPQTFNVQNTLIPKFPNLQKVIVTTSIPNIQAAISSIGPNLTKGRDVIKYDPEVWSYTPPTEYDDTLPGGQTIAQSISQAADLVHGERYLFAIAPQSKGTNKPNPSLFQHYQTIDWTKVDYLSIQMQLSLDKVNDVNTVKQIYQFVKTKSPNTKIFVNIGLVPGTTYTPDQMVSLLNNLQSYYDGIGILYLPGQTCSACSDTNLDNLLDLIRGSTSPTPSNNTTPTGQIPSWLKYNAKEWHDGSVNNSSFVQVIQYFIQVGRMQKPPITSTGALLPQIPVWVKNNAGWWSNGEITDNDFVSGIQYLVQQGIIKF